MIVKDENDGPMIVQKLVALICPREIFNLAIKHPDEGGFDGARDSDGKVVMSETTMPRHWPNWIVQMTNRFKATCVCDKCGVPTEVQESYNLRRRAIIKKLHADVERMPSSRSKTAFTERLKKR